MYSALMFRNNQQRKATKGVNTHAAAARDDRPRIEQCSPQRTVTQPTKNRFTGRSRRPTRRWATVNATGDDSTKSTKWSRKQRRTTGNTSRKGEEKHRERTTCCTTRWSLIEKGLRCGPGASEACGVRLGARRPRQPPLRAPTQFRQTSIHRLARAQPNRCRPNDLGSHTARTEKIGEQTDKRSSNKHQPTSGHSKTGQTNRTCVRDTRWAEAFLDSRTRKRPPIGP